jgi:acyl-coenzyme A synthetase/AMP-(fatty) acid ligase
MVYLGRVDNQVKVQGYRVELGEVEAIIREEASVEAAIALGWPETAAGADSILVFISDERADLVDVIARAKGRLPAYMAPREVRHIDQFPLNSNGKIDRGALRALLLAEG